MSVYESLETRETVRFLRVHRDSNGSIVGELKPFSLDAPGRPRYRPISYVWGSKAEEKSITLNGTAFSVLATVYPILELFCDNPEFKDARPWLWIDSICINQDDLEERSAQVALMTRIFGHTCYTTIWLGESTPSSDRGMDLMKLVADGEEQEELKHDPKLQDLDAWRDYEQVALNPWFRRAWTLQEGITGPDDTTCVYFYGNKKLTRWQVICASVATWYRMPEDCPVDRDSWAPLWNRRRIYHWYRGRDPGRFVSLLALMAFSCQTKASDPRDHIYSLLGVVNRWDREAVGLPTYHLDVEVVYTDLVRKWVQKHESLDIICFAQMCHRRYGSMDSKLPSWVPDWRNRVIRSAVATPMLVSQSGKRHIGNFRPLSEAAQRGALQYNATGAEKPQVIFSDDGQRLTCKGVLVDILDGVGGMADARHPNSDVILEPCIQSISPINTLDLSDKGIPSTSSMAEPEKVALATTVGKEIVLSLAHGRGDIYLQWAAPILRFLKEFKEMAFKGIRDGINLKEDDCVAWYDLNKSLLVRGMTLEEICENIEPSDETELRQESETERKTDGQYPVFVERFSHTTGMKELTRRLITTEKGYVGTAPRQARKGDVVCVLFGCSVPVILSPRPIAGNVYEFIGEAYMEGFMNGEALKKDKQEMEFVLI
ncbi:heterokaryon incompatibility protein-domain-containing protein [Whalleya microplaca]|nr:heterokaryon incompatibility protein-domain-containing protein [Whalleya microplaca]